MMPTSESPRDPLIDSLRCFLDLVETVEKEVKRSAADLLKPGLLRHLQTLAKPNATVDQLYRAQKEVLLLQDLLEEADLLSADVVKRQVAAVATALDRRIYTRVLARAEEALADGPRKGLLQAALFWANGTAGPGELRNLAPFLEHHLPEPYDSLRQSAVRRLHSLDEESSGRRQEGQEERPPRRTPTVEVLPPQGRRLRFLATQEDGSPLDEQSRARLEQELDGVRRERRLTGQEAQVRQPGRYPIFNLPENLSQLVMGRVPGIHIEEDVFLFTQSPRKPHLRLKVFDQETADPLVGIAIDLHAKNSRRSRRVISAADGVVAFPVSAAELERLQVHVSPTHSHWSRILERDALHLDKEILVPLELHGQSSWWPTEASPERAPNMGEGVSIALIDTGVASHPDLSLAGGCCVPSIQDQRWDEDSETDGHGTVCAGVINAQGGEGRLMGLAPRADLWGIRATADPSGRFHLSDIADAIRQAVDDYSVDLINLSLGTPQHSPVLIKTIQDARKKGVLLVAAAGNLGQEGILYPARLDGVLGVGAYGHRGAYPAGSLHSLQETDRSHEERYIARFSCHGKGLDICAPGVGILSTLPGDEYGVRDGTSFAAPFVTAFAACLLSSDPELRQGTRSAERADRLRNHLLARCQPLGQLDSRFQGAGKPGW